MQERREGFRQGLAELIERDLLPLLNLMVLLLPLVLVGLELAARSAIAVTLPDPSPDVATLDTPPAPRRESQSRPLGAEDHKQPLGAETTPARELESETASRASELWDSPLGYGG
jgi:biopolymer transport protein ExbD